LIPTPTPVNPVVPPRPFVPPPTPVTPVVPPTPVNPVVLPLPNETCTQHNYGPQFGKYNTWRQNWNCDTNGIRILHFDVQAKNDIHVAFSNKLATTVPMYEIVIGGWGNSKTAIRRQSQGAELCSVQKGFTSSNSRTRFTITLDENQGRIVVSQNNNVIINCQDPNFIKNLEFFDFSTWDTPITYWLCEVQTQAPQPVVPPQPVRQCTQHNYGPQFGKYNTWRQDWNCDTNGKRTLHLDAQAQNDIHVAFSNKLGTTVPMYEIVIGGWGNSRSAIRRQSQGAELCSAQRSISPPNTRTRFTITLDEKQGRVTVTENDDIILNCPDSNFIKNLEFYDLSTWNTPITYWIC